MNFQGKPDIIEYVNTRCLCGHLRRSHMHAHKEVGHLKGRAVHELFVVCGLCHCDHFTSEIERRVGELTFPGEAPTEHAEGA